MVDITSHDKADDQRNMVHPSTTSPIKVPHGENQAIAILPVVPLSKRRYKL
jgi:hypothetical protein